MKHLSYAKYILLSLAVFLNVEGVMGQQQSIPNINQFGTWGEREMTGYQEYPLYLTGDIEMTGTWHLKDGCHLRIYNKTGKDIRIKNAKTGGNLENMFKIDSGCTLIIGESDSDARIILDGGAGFTWSAPDDYSYALTPAKDGKQMTGAAIQSSGTINFTNVTIQHVWTDLATKGAISIDGDRKKLGPTTLTNCVIELCRAYEGVALYCGPETTAETADNPYLQNDAESCKREITGGKIWKCVALSDGGNPWGGIIRTRGASIGHLKMTGVEMSYNYAEEGCAGLFWNSGGRNGATPWATIDGCRFEYNRTAMEGGAIRIETNMEFVRNKTIISHNYAGSIGGGLHIYGYAGGGTVTTGGTYQYNLTEFLEVTDNRANNGGGGIAFQLNDKCTLNENIGIEMNLIGARIANNEVLGVRDNATDDYGGGGGIFFTRTHDNLDNWKKWPTKINLNHGTIENNKAAFGGGVYVRDVNIGYSTDDPVYIQNNTAKINGGGIYLEKGNIELSAVNVLNNVVEKEFVEGIQPQDKIGCGGGIFLEEGDFTIVSGRIAENTCNKFGGGIFVNSKAAEERVLNVKFLGGEIEYNSAYAGGGVAVIGKSKTILRNTKVQHNTAVNGGGILVSESGADLEYQGGLIRYNNALKLKNTTVNNTAYLRPAIARVDYNEVPNHGIGGGIYVGNEGQLKIVKQYTNEDNQSVDTKIGIYSNIAETGADDIFANGNETHVTVPSVNNMDLDDYVIPVLQGNLYWMEDYVSFAESQIYDTNYMAGTSLYQNWNNNQKNFRYRYAMYNEPDMIFHLDNTKDYNFPLSDGSNYVCLTIGYPVVHAKIIKSGMKEGESALFNVSYTNEGVTTPYVTSVLTGTDDNGSSVERTIVLPYNTWTVTEHTPWSWAYSSETDYTKSEPDDVERKLGTNPPSVKYVINEASNTLKQGIWEFRFKNTHKDKNNEIPTLPLHDEGIKVNEMPGGSTSNSGGTSSGTIRQNVRVMKVQKK